ncbi:MAG: hypothetical protein P8J45_01260 [Phycisphaerales bacterium]|nr:hypothetical protein [Phycisphaerales bacterium]
MYSIASRLPKKVRVFLAVLLTVALVPCPCALTIGITGSSDPGTSGVLKLSTIPFMLIMLAVVAGAWWYALRSFKCDFPERFCTVCGYDVRGNAHERCPECGEPMDPMEPT